MSNYHPDQSGYYNPENHAGWHQKPELTPEQQERQAIFSNGGFPYSNNFYQNKLEGELSGPLTNNDALYQPGSFGKFFGSQHKLSSLSFPGQDILSGSSQSNTNSENFPPSDNYSSDPYSSSFYSATNFIAKVYTKILGPDNDNDMSQRSQNGVPNSDIYSTTTTSKSSLSGPHSNLNIQSGKSSYDIIQSSSDATIEGGVPLSLDPTLSTTDTSSQQQQSVMDLEGLSPYHDSHGRYYYYHGFRGKQPNHLLQMNRKHGQLSDLFTYENGYKDCYWDFWTYYRLLEILYILWVAKQILFYRFALLKNRAHSTDLFANDSPWKGKVGLPRHMNHESSVNHSSWTIRCGIFFSTQYPTLHSYWIKLSNAIQWRCSQLFNGEVSGRDRGTSMSVISGINGSFDEVQPYLRSSNNHAMINQNNSTGNSMISNYRGQRAQVVQSDRLSVMSNQSRNLNKHSHLDQNNQKQTMNHDHVFNRNKTHNNDNQNDQSRMWDMQSVTEMDFPQQGNVNHNRPTRTGSVLSWMDLRDDVRNSNSELGFNPNQQNENPNQRTTLVNQNCQIPQPRCYGPPMGGIIQYGGLQRNNNIVESLSLSDTNGNSMFKSQNQIRNNYSGGQNNFERNIRSATSVSIQNNRHNRGSLRDTSKNANAIIHTRQNRTPTRANNYDNQNISITSDRDSTKKVKTRTPSAIKDAQTSLIRTGNTPPLIVNNQAAAQSRAFPGVSSSNTSNTLNLNGNKNVAVGKGEAATRQLKFSTTSLDQSLSPRVINTSAISGIDSLNNYSLNMNNLNHDERSEYLSHHGTQVKHKQNPNQIQRDQNHNNSSSNANSEPFCHVGPQVGNSQVSNQNQNFFRSSSGSITKQSQCFHLNADTAASRGVGNDDNNVWQHRESRDTDNSCNSMYRDHNLIQSNNSIPKQQFNTNYSQQTQNKIHIKRNTKNTSATPQDEYLWQSKPSRDRSDTNDLDLL